MIKSNMISKKGYPLWKAKSSIPSVRIAYLAFKTKTFKMMNHSRTAMLVMFLISKQMNI